MKSVILIYMGLILVGVGGWIVNIIKLTQCSFDPLSTEGVVRVIGAFIAPVGSVLGFIGHF